MARQRNNNGRPNILALVLAAGLGAGASWAVLDPNALSIIKDKSASVGLAPGCDIKGNISINSGERIYHMPGQADYSATIIRPEYGERWFCTEDEARAAGWRKARN